MAMPVSLLTFPEPFRRLLAAGGAALVLALTIFAACPTAHASLHDAGCPHHQPDNDEGCAVTIFASGVSLPVGPMATAPVVFLPRAVPVAPAADVFLVSPRYLRQPERGPPASSVG